MCYVLGETKSDGEREVLLFDALTLYVCYVLGEAKSDGEREVLLFDL